MIRQRHKFDSFVARRRLPPGFSHSQGQSRRSGDVFNKSAVHPFADQLPSHRIGRDGPAPYRWPLAAANRGATHPVNAILNYAYAILEGQVRIAVVAEGFLPTLGFLHAHKPDRLALVLDFVEPLRPLVDRKVLEFVQTHTFHPADFTINKEGVCRLNPEMAKCVVRLISSLNDNLQNIPSL